MRTSAHAANHILQPQGRPGGAGTAMKAIVQNANNTAFQNAVCPYCRIGHTLVLALTTAPMLV